MRPKEQQKIYLFSSVQWLLQETKSNCSPRIKTVSSITFNSQGVFAIYVQQGYKENIRNSRVIYGVILEFQSVSGHLTVFIFPKKFIDITIGT